MKIEKLNEKQIRCTLSKKDLADRKLKISELAYGTEKAKALFREMMQIANAEYGFEAEDIPLMIEAIPVSPDCLVLVVTKVDNPEELDTRFSKFTNNLTIDDDSDEYYETEYTLSKDATESDGSDEADSAKESIMNCFGQLSELIEQVAKKTGKSFVPLDATIDIKEVVPAKKVKKSDKKELSPNEVRLYKFNSLENVIKTCSFIYPHFKGNSSLYKSEEKPYYFLLVSPSDKDDVSFNRVCSIISEYAPLERTSYATKDFLDEHFTLVINENAVGNLSKL